MPSRISRFSLAISAAIALCGVAVPVAFADIFNMGAGVTSLETVFVGNASNTADSTGYGAVNYTYAAGKYEVTAAQYTVFLNAVAQTDSYGLYNTEMNGTYGCKIVRSGTDGNYSYSTTAGYENRPVNYVSFGDAARFANWLHNGQPTGAQGAGTTETGAYTLNGANTNAALQAVTRNADWKWAITSENEWYKAAYHKNDGDTGNYYTYPTASNSVPSCRITNPDQGNNANYKYDQTTIDFTVVGEFENSDSPYGTFDQGGNLWEWTEGIQYGGNRATRGGSAFHTADRMSKAYRDYSQVPTYESGAIGFRVVAVPEPGTLVLLTVGCAGLMARRRAAKA